MKPFNQLSITLGSLIVICLLIVFENLFGMVYFIPTDALILNHELFLQNINRLPGSFYVLVLFCNSMACYLGGMLPMIIADERIRHSIYIGTIVTLFAILNAFIIPFPVWYKIISISICLPLSYLGGIFTKRLYQYLN